MKIPRAHKRKGWKSKKNPCFPSRTTNLSYILEKSVSWSITKSQRRAQNKTGRWTKRVRFPRIGKRLKLSMKIPSNIYIYIYVYTKLEQHFYQTPSRKPNRVNFQKNSLSSRNDNRGNTNRSRVKDRNASDAEHLRNAETHDGSNYRRKDNKKIHDTCIPYI